MLTYLFVVQTLAVTGIGRLPLSFVASPRPSIFPRTNGNTRDAIPWSPCAEFREQTTETGANKAYPISYSKWVAFVLQDRGQE